MTDPRPRNPPKLWAEILLTWRPRPGLPGDLHDLPARYILPMTNRGQTNWHAYDPNPPAVITHTIDLKTGQTASEAFIDPPTEEYEPLETLTPGAQPVESWTPYKVAALPLSTAPGSTAATIAFSQDNPDRTLPAPVLAMPGITGIFGPLVIENRAKGPNARTRALTCARPGIGQQALNSRFATGAMFWQSMPQDGRTAWVIVAKDKAPALTGYAFFLGFVLTNRPERVSQLERQYAVTLPLPPV